MSNTFFITGYPRSRTAWLANFMTTGQAHCFHDVFEKCYPKVEEVGNILARPSVKFVGAAGSDLPFFADVLDAAFPHAKHVLIKRNLLDVKLSLSDFYGADMSEFMGLATAKIAEYAARFNPLVIGFDELDTFEGIKKIWRHCLHGERFNHDRWQMLRHFNVQLSDSKRDELRRLLWQQ